MTSVELLRQSLRLLPDAIRIILTIYRCRNLMGSQQLQIFRYIVKPWDPPDC
jgi:hypothetical protein